MAIAPVIEIPSLLAPIPGDSPSGTYPIPFDQRSKLDESRTEVLPDPDDPMAPEPKKADWPVAIRTAQEVLKGTSKDLLTAARLTEGLTKQHGFAGLRDGLRLMREMVEQCWDRLNPPIEDGDVEVRAGPFYWLDDPDKGARFPTSLRRLPMLEGPERTYSWMDWRNSQDGKGDVTREEFEKAILAAPYEKCEALATVTEETVEEVGKLAASLMQKMGQAAPGLTGLRQTLDECRRLAKQVLDRKPKPVTEEESAAGDGAATASEGGGGARMGQVARGRADVYRQLAQAAEVLRQLEPHSPIPYLIERAVSLGNLSFPDLIKVLVRDATILSELNREFGIEEPPAQ